MNPSQLPSELLVLIFKQLVEVHTFSIGQEQEQQQQQQQPPLLTAQAAAAVTAAASAHPCWRAACLAEVRCRIRLDSATDALHLAAAPGLPCTELQLPQVAPAAHDPAEWLKQQQLMAAIEQLLCSNAFRRRSGATLRRILHLPVAVAERGALAGSCFASLHTLILSPGLCIGSPDSLRGSSLGPCPPPALRHLEVQLPTGGLLSHLLWPANLQHCSIMLPECARPPSQLALQPCPCPSCQAGGGCGAFWGSVRSLRVQAAGAALQVDSALLRLLRGCTYLHLQAGCGQRSRDIPDAAIAALSAAGTAAGAGAAPDLQPWLAALAPVFAATSLQTFILQAACAALRPPSQPASGWLLQAGERPAAWEGPRLAAASLGQVGSWEERSVGLGAQLKLDGEASQFQLRVWRCEE